MTHRRNELAASVHSAIRWLESGGEPSVAIRDLQRAYEIGVPRYELGVLTWDRYSWDHDLHYHELLDGFLHYLVPAVSELFQPFDSLTAV